MADEFTILNVGAGGSVMDETGVTFSDDPTDRKRPRIVLAGDTPEALAPVLNTAPSIDEYGVVTRNMVGCEHPGTAFWECNTATLVPSDSETTIATYTVADGESLFVTSWFVSGDVNAKYCFYYEDSPVAYVRTSVAQLSQTVIFNVARPIAAAGATVTVTATHGASGILANFEATILGYLVPAS